ncbi:MAG: LD-carboxypeptidase [Bacteroidota bacterium]|nr:LD-carboxypeptidase [Bacteroidota bacterium]
MIIPPKLKSGDIVAIVAPSRKVSPAQLDAALIVLESWGLTTKLGNNIFSDRHSYLAGTDDERCEDFQSMIDDPQVKAIFCARGGYGSTRIVEDIDFTPLKRSPKWVIGFSDITAFHLRLLSVDVASMHATMPIFFGREEAQASVETIGKALFDGECNIVFPAGPYNRPGKASGQVLGGNLSLIADALNTPSDPQMDGKILIVEEVDEYYYKLDRMFTQLRRTGKLRNLAGLVIGHMTDIKNSDLDFGETVFDIVTHAVRDYNYPLAFSFPSGHANPNDAWIQGAPAVLNIGSNSSTLAYPNIYSPNE